MTAAIMIRVPNLNMVEVEVRAWLTLTPGLVVHQSIGDPGWAVTHQRSGLLVAFVDDPESAQAIAAELGAVADWTQSATTLKALRVAGAVGAIVRNCIPTVNVYGPPVDRNVLEQ